MVEALQAVLQQQHQAPPPPNPQNAPRLAILTRNTINHYPPPHQNEGTQEDPNDDK